MDDIVFCERLPEAEKKKSGLFLPGLHGWACLNLRPSNMTSASASRRQGNAIRRCT
jgi:hypothetical protein